MKKRDKILQAAKQRLTEKFGDKIKDVFLFGPVLGASRPVGRIGILWWLFGVIMIGGW